MSEEEKKAIEYLKEQIHQFKKSQKSYETEIEDKIYAKKIVMELQGDINNIFTILNLIEKQQKEIERYKRIASKKIEEINDEIKRDMINYDKVEDETWKLAIHRSMAQKIEIKKVLQSLLEQAGILDLMVQDLSTSYNAYEPCYIKEDMDCEKYINCEDCIKEYFYKKAEQN